MSARPTAPRMSFEAYLAWEAQQTERHEFFAGEVFAMTGARMTHNTIALNIAMWLRQALRGTPCRVFIAEAKLHVAAADAAFYPDVLVSGDPRDRGRQAELVQRHPRLVVEVLSESTAAFDRGRKFGAYRRIDTLEAYLLVEQDEVHAELFLRNAEGLWVLHPVGEGGSVDVSPLGITLPLSAVYEGVEFGAAPEAQPG